MMADTISSEVDDDNHYIDSNSPLPLVTASGDQEEKDDGDMPSLPKKDRNDGKDNNYEHDGDDDGNNYDQNTNAMKGDSNDHERKEQNDRNKKRKKKRKKRKVKCVKAEIHDDIISMTTNMMMLPNAPLKDNDGRPDMSVAKKISFDQLDYYIPSNQYECSIVRRGIWAKKSTSEKPSKIKNNNHEQRQQQPNDNIKKISNSGNSTFKSSPTTINESVPLPFTQQQQNQQRRTIFGVPLIDSFPPISIPGISEHNDLKKTNNHDNKVDHNLDMTSLKTESKEEEEVYIKGDLSLGMKLNVKKGFVVVGAVTSLADGRASPAQLTGLIRQGDILVSINGISILNLPLQQLMQRLKLLSSKVENNNDKHNSTATTPNINNKIQKQFTLRFKTTTSNEINSVNNQLTTSTSKTDNKYHIPATTSKLKQEYGFVDQFSGLPLFPSTMEEPTSQSFAISPLNQESQTHDESEDITTPDDAQNEQIMNNTNILSAHSLFHQKIATYMANQRKMEKRLYTSQFFTLNPKFSKLLRSDSIPSSFTPDLSNYNNKTTGSRPLLTRKEWIELGTLAMSGARIICDEMEFGKLRHDQDNADNESNIMRLKQKGKRKDPLAIIWSDGRSFSSRSRFSKTSPLHNSNHNNSPKKTLFTVEDDSLENDDNTSSGYDSDPNMNNNNENNSNVEDELLFQLAASNNEWKDDMIHALEQLSVEKREMESNKQNNSAAKEHKDEEQKVNQNNDYEKNQKRNNTESFTTKDQDLTPPTSHRRKSFLNSISDDVQIEQQLTSILFGEENVKKINKIMKHKSSALPPDEFTVVLYDLALKVSDTLPRNISIRKPDFSIAVETNNSEKNVSTENQNQLHNYDGNNDDVALFIKKIDQDLFVASTFLIEKAIPAWLKTFHPLSWKHRFLFWPVGGSSIPYDQEPLSSGLSLTSSNTIWKSQSFKKTLEETIEEIEINPESRNETCSLVLFYFTRKILPEVTQKRRNNNRCNNTDTKYDFNFEDEAVSFVERYGSYLDLSQALIHSAEIHAQNVIESLLKMAKNDPGHRETMERLSKGNTLLLYENNMLSALLSSIPTFFQQKNEAKQKDQIALFVSAYPDLKPWQIRNKIAMLLQTEKSYTYDPKSSLYYEYLCMLLHPTEGIDIARQEPNLVKEWCKLSLNEYKDSPDRHGLSNFLIVASRMSTDWMSYHRDVPMLLELSMSFNKDDFDLALNLAEEIIQNDQYRLEKIVLERTLSYLRSIAKSILENTGNESSFQPIEIKSLRQTIKLMHAMGSSDSVITRNSINVSNEFIKLLQLCKPKQELSLLCLLAGTGASIDVLHTLKEWHEKSPSEFNMSILTTLRIALTEGVSNGLQTEISSSLLRLKYARRTNTHFSQSSEPKSSVDISGIDTTNDENRTSQCWNPSSGFSSGMIWKKLSRGVAIIEK